MSCAAMLPSQRRSKLKASEAALLAGELTKPSWQSRNEGIHERVSFEDSIWGFDLAGGSFYKTPLRVTAVKQDSRAEKAGIRPGDQLLRINDIDTSTLTIQEAHAIIIESGVHIRLAVSAPDDTEDSYHCWQDEINNPYDSDEERRKEEEKAKKRVIHCRTNANWSLQWPWVSKRRIIYKESNCFMVPSKYESKHREKFPEQAPGLKTPEDIVLHSKTSNTPTTEGHKHLEFPKPALTSEIINGTNGNSEKERKALSGQENESNDKNDSKETKKVETREEINASTMSMAIDEENLEEINKDAEASSVTSQSRPDDNDTELDNWNPNDVNCAMDEDVNSFDGILENTINEQDNLHEVKQDQLLDEVLNGHEVLHVRNEDEQN